MFTLIIIIFFQLPSCTYILCHRRQQLSFLAFQLVLANQSEKLFSQATTGSTQRTFPALSTELTLLLSSSKTRVPTAIVIGSQLQLNSCKKYFVLQLLAIAYKVMNKISYLHEPDFQVRVQYEIKTHHLKEVSEHREEVTAPMRKRD